MVDPEYCYRPGTLPYAQNSPQKCKYDLYAEQVYFYDADSNFGTLNGIPI